MLFESDIQENKPAFVQGVQSMSNDLQVPADWPMLMMKVESDINPKAVNPVTNATGLIQFMSATATALGTSVQALYNMNNVQQLSWVHKYYKPYKSYITKLADLYLVTLYPNADGKHAGTLKKPDTWAFPDFVYRANKKIDVTEDGVLTIADVKAWLESKIPADAQSQQIYHSTADTTSKFFMRNLAWIVTGTVLFSFGLYYFILTTK